MDSGNSTESTVDHFQPELLEKNGLLVHYGPVGFVTLDWFLDNVPISALDKNTSELLYVHCSDCIIAAEMKRKEGCPDTAEITHYRTKGIEKCGGSNAKVWADDICGREEVVFKKIA